MIKNNVLNIESILKSCKNVTCQLTNQSFDINSQVICKVTDVNQNE